ncbi:DUF1361 domain-containing protein [Leeuwenhoekiella marinoflava]|uniref:Uncharacterized membrane protein n=2 Tax=Leeuwenhoekiella marinoflava TaxID=988 RepID=A0ABY1HSF8_9FLAO|nr:DUF1361 domain-containing protein [Leeuwenhoekiella marinoflava]RXG29937.1 putative membrane protein [Leeuwenhoekiella marinoflava]SHF25783.1 Uncharacterized membrane protein [Leeuwenhoekiella marinoflava DSM 3653]
MKEFILTKYATLKYLFIALLVCFLLLVFRIKTTHDTFGLFLVWNLFLAFIPLGIVWFMQFNKKLFLNPIKKILTLVLWLLFLPNAPYVLTDLIHLSYSPSQWFIYDAMVILAFAGISLYFGFQSILELRRLLKNKINKKLLNIATLSILVLCGFGVYLGRVVRFNSWDLVTNPFELFTTIFQFLINPIEHKLVWLFTLVFEIFLNAAFYIFQLWHNSIGNYDTTQ